MALPSPGPIAADSASAITRAGIASRMSTMRPITASVVPPRYPATLPMAMPSDEPISTIPSPTPSDARAPWINRERMSRPTSSVPAQCAALGGCSRAARSMASGG